MKTTLLLFTLLFTPLTFAQSPPGSGMDERLKQILSHPVKQVEVKGLGKVEVGDVLVHKNIGKGMVKGLYINNGIPWVRFSVNNMSSFVYLSSDYFKSLEKQK